MQRIMVDLPEPDGPHTTIRSRRSTARLMSRSTWKSPYHLCTPTISMATLFLVVCIFGPAAASRAGRRSVVVVSVIASSGPSPALGRAQPPLDEQRIARHAEAEEEIHDPGKGKAGEQGDRRRPVGVREGGPQLP